ncbi:MAG: J domain-containing protein [Armatimonadetes bacterium]|nr:J domain-containing protein [Armatimonadota bacterium]
MASGGTSALKRDPYKVLGVPPIAGKDDIRKAYRELAKQYHPDLNPHQPVLAQERMKELTEAYDLVSNPDARKEYDGQPQFQLRIPRDFDRASRGGDGRKSDSSLWKKLRGVFGKSSDRSGGVSVERELFADCFSTGVSCFQFAGGKMMPQAEQDFARALEARPDSLESLYNLALVQYRLGKFDQAMLNFKNVLKKVPADPGSRRMVDALQGWD